MGIVCCRIGRGAAKPEGDRQRSLLVNALLRPVPATAAGSASCASCSAGGGSTSELVVRVKEAHVSAGEASVMPVGLSVALRSVTPYGMLNKLGQSETSWMSAASVTWNYECSWLLYRSPDSEFTVDETLLIDVFEDLAAGVETRTLVGSACIDVPQLLGYAGFPEDEDVLFAETAECAPHEILLHRDSRIVGKVMIEARVRSIASSMQEVDPPQTSDIVATAVRGGLFSNSSSDEEMSLSVAERRQLTHALGRMRNNRNKFKEGSDSNASTYDESVQHQSSVQLVS